MVCNPFSVTGWKSAHAAILVVAMTTSIANAQYRENAPPVIEKAPPRVVQDPRPAVIQAFAKDYRAGGQPKIVLFWGVAFDDNLEVDARKVSRKDTVESGTHSGLDKTTSGPAGNSTLREGDYNKKKVETTEDRTIQADSSKRPMPFSPRDGAELRQAFLYTMREGGVSFLDRDLIVRTSSVALKSKDVKSLETQAATKGAKYILEVLTVPDDKSPSGVGFTLSLKELASGVETASSFVHANPWLPPAGEDRYVATNKGFEARSAPRPKATIRDVGIALAIEVMRTIGPPIGAR